MSYAWQRWLADELRAEVKRLGLNVQVIEVAGWENRGRPASTGSYDPTGAHTVHHTGATSSPTNTGPTLQTLILGRPDLPGPLAQVSVRYDGDIVVIAAGRCNHAGAIGKSGVLGMPLGADGNALAIGDEVETNGTQALPPDQIRSMAIVGRVVTRHDDRGVEWIHRHQDISGTGKWDIGNRTTPQLRNDAQQLDQEDDMQLSDEYADGKRIGQLYRRLDAFLTNVGPRLKGIEGDLEKLRDEVSNDASSGQAEKALRRLEKIAASIREVRELVDVDEPEQPEPQQ